MRRKFRHEVSASGYSQVNVFGLTACQAAYEGGEEWLKALKQYIWDNYLMLKNYLEEKIPEIQPVTLEGTYLVWMDFRSLGMTEKERLDLIENRAQLWLDSGAMFGEDGGGFERINIACPRKLLEQALCQLEEALRQVREIKK